MRIGTWALGAAVLLCVGCGGKTKYFKVSSFPQGATVYVNGEPRGQTDFDRLKVKFDSRNRLATVRVEKDGYQTTGAVLSPESQQEIAFFLQQAPKNEEILNVLKGIHQVLDRVSSELSRPVEESSQ